MCVVVLAIVIVINIGFLLTCNDRVAISIGVALAGSHGYDRNLLIRRADHALYAAKKGGRNQVVIAASVENGIASMAPAW